MGSLLSGTLGTLLDPLGLVRGLTTRPTPPSGPAAPRLDDRAVQAAAAEAARRRARARGYRSTLLSQQFLEPDAPARQQTLGT